MATIKSYTNIEQSKKLAEILPIDSADCFWQYQNSPFAWDNYEDYPIAVPYIEYGHMENEWKEDKADIPCWSLAALFSILPTIAKNEDIANSFIAKTPDNGYYVVYATPIREIDSSAIYDNPVDACYEMILTLHEQKLL